ncbi:hypothetical protein CASFOL_041922 [Castilleja foliolosa]|uniref:Uncharacterized protein n=1 Tax=Castilleja foliolosa TaxID=1961234 RepID=A0ABD3B9J7_9LAMI
MAQSGGDEMKSSGNDGGDGDRKGKVIAAPAIIPAADSSSSSSIGKQSSDDDEDDTEEVKAPSSALDCLAALENSLPMKRGLSACYAGKSKSFGNLTDLPLEDSKDLEKEEHHVNKKRRLLRAHKTFYATKTGGSSSPNVGPAALPSDDQTNEEAADDVDENKGEDQKQDRDD